MHKYFSILEHCNILNKHVIFITSYFKIISNDNVIENTSFLLLHDITIIINNTRKRSVPCEGREHR